MKITFSDTVPSNARLVAHIADKGKTPDGLEKALVEGADAARFKGNPGQCFEGFVERGGAVVRVAIAGAGKKDVDARGANLEKAGAALTAKYLTSGEKSLVLDLNGSGLDAAETASLLLGLRLRGWRHDAYRTRLKEEQKVSLDQVTVVGAPDGTDAAWEDACAVAEGVEFTRDLVAEPANVLFPVSFVEKCQEKFAGTGAELIVLDDAQMEELGMGALLGVGLGSEQPSRMLAIRWNGGAEGEKPTAFVGKGVCFDTGGISLKPGPGMGDMKFDMGGSGAVVGAMLAMVKRKAKANVVGVVGLVENMPDGRAMRPGDVVTSMSGQTIEVLNTDAEGRLVLCDALHWTQKEFAPKQIVDFATLTGAIIISLGNEHAGLFSNNDDLSEKLLASGKSSGDKLWRLPLSPAYDKQINSPIADMQNIGGKGAGSITAAQFLQRFIMDDTPWAHCDIAGTVWADKPGPTYDKGATGYGVRLIDNFVRENCEG
ncbi:leucyl aminopeptidase [Pontixanthobacter aquaemixtae]|uniref:Probable cytosol aminopeptidase n=1 Tax=Pontixanthobacter aquaemixtae TaxID=1958940 RepID=A0A844ZU14_9SPHN|nr:leucyl aminopeptidase [Pontixanthobacter aquaemixtae]MXO90772.1 leucyl aminopeptidase [Pontixanthobacter aquaemixtae]